MARLAKSLEHLRDQVNGAYPDRSITADGWIGDAAHRKRKSDHNPDSKGVVKALDITHDPAHGLHARELAENLISSRDERISYIISEGEIISSTESPWQWRKYKGSNGHYHHVHISVKKDFDSEEDWTITGGPPPRPTLKKGSTGIWVTKLQRALKDTGFSIDVDGEFGPKTEKAVKNYQEANGLEIDGIAGSTTLDHLQVF